MSGSVWHIFTIIAAAVFLVVMIYRVLSIVRQPVHLRWELAPIPHDKGKAKYGGSYLEDYEWWRKKRRKSLSGVIFYMAGEIFLLKGVWKNNRSLWPFSFALHTGIYLFILVLVLYLINAIFTITGTPLAVQNVFRGITAFAAALGCITGSLGAVGLILKRLLDTNLRNFSSLATYFRLIWLAAVFISGGIAMLYADNYASEMSLFVKDIITLNSAVTVPAVSSVHIVISLLFIVYLPFTDMAHFITKYFTYHAVRWDDDPQNKRMVEKIRNLAAQPVTWSAEHAGADGGKNWTDLTNGTVEKEKS